MAVAAVFATLSSLSTSAADDPRPARGYERYLVGNGADADHPTPYVYFMRTSRPPERCQPGQPLAIRDVEVYRLAPGGRFDLAEWKGQNGIAYTLSVDAGVLRSSRDGMY